jgi:hypothetical protein
MSIQKHLGENPEPYSKYHLKEIPDSYSRMLDHEVCEWEQPYGYEVNPMEPMEYEAVEHSKKYR